jgi:hypothetical protein
MRYGQRDRDECLRRAGNTRDQIIRAEYLCLAQEWADMADEVRRLAASVYAVQTTRLKRKRVFKNRDDVSI